MSSNRSGNLGGGEDGSKDLASLQELIASGSIDLKVLENAVIVQKVLTASGLSPEDMGKAALVQKAMLDSGATPKNVTGSFENPCLGVRVSLAEWYKCPKIILKNSCYTFFCRLFEKDLAGIWN